MVIIDSKCFFEHEISSANLYHHLPSAANLFHDSTLTSSSILTRAYRAIYLSVIKSAGVNDGVMMTAWTVVFRMKRMKLLGVAARVWIIWTVAWGESYFC